MTKLDRYITDLFKLKENSLDKNLITEYFKEGENSDTIPRDQNGQQILRSNSA